MYAQKRNFSNLDKSWEAGDIAEVMTCANFGDDGKPFWDHGDYSCVRGL